MTFIHNAWYAAAWSHEIQRTLLARTILQEPVVLFRREDGEPAALADRCPHRFVPLHRGTLKGDTVECGYHGLCFNSQGSCVLNPHGNGLIPKAAQVRAYPLVESQGVVWIWMGPPELADPSTIVRFEPLEDPAFETVHGYLHVQANYQLISDNLLDLTHGQYVHPLFRNAAGPAAMEESPVSGDTVWARFVRRDQLPNGYFKMLGFPPEQRGDHRNYMRWNPPGNLLLDVGMTTVGGRPEEGLSIPTTHLLTPETETSSHYFWAMSRNFRTDDRPWRRAAARGHRHLHQRRQARDRGTAGLHEVRDRPIQDEADPAVHGCTGGARAAHAQGACRKGTTTAAGLGGAGTCEMSTARAP